METMEWEKGTLRKKQEELTDTHEACHPVDQTSAHRTELFTLSQESMVSGPCHPPVQMGSWRSLPSTMLHATPSWWASYISKTWHHIEVFDCYF